MLLEKLPAIAINTSSKKVILQAFNFKRKAEFSKILRSKTRITSVVKFYEMISAERVSNGKSLVKIFGMLMESLSYK